MHDSALTFTAKYPPLTYNMIRVDTEPSCGRVDRHVWAVLGLLVEIYPTPTLAAWKIIGVFKEDIMGS